MDCPLKYANAYCVDVECTHTQCAWWMIGRVNECAIMVLSWILTSGSESEFEIASELPAPDPTDVPFD